MTAKVPSLFSEGSSNPLDQAAVPGRSHGDAGREGCGCADDPVRARSTCANAVWAIRHHDERDAKPINRDGKLVILSGKVRTPFLITSSD